MPPLSSVSVVNNAQFWYDKQIVKLIFYTTNHDVGCIGISKALQIMGFDEYSI